MTRISRLTDQLFTGADLPRHSVDEFAAELDRWEQRGITHIVDNRIEASDLDALADLAPDITYCENGEDDAGQVMPDSWFDAGVGFALEAMTDPAARVHVHCHMGINRGPSLAYAVLLAQGWAPVAGLALVRSARPVAAAGYAEQALDWWHRSDAAAPDRRRQERRELAAWRQANPHDTVRIIQRVHDEEWQQQLVTKAGHKASARPTLAS